MAVHEVVVELQALAFGWPDPPLFSFHVSENVRHGSTTEKMQTSPSLMSSRSAILRRDACKRSGVPVETWPELSPLRGLSVATGKTVINAINAFIISRRFQDEVAEKRRVDDLENRLNEALELNERYGKRLEELVASQRGTN